MKYATQPRFNIFFRISTGVFMKHCYVQRKLLAALICNL